MSGRLLSIAPMSGFAHIEKDGMRITLPVQVRDDGTLFIDVEEAKRKLEAHGEPKS